MGRKILKGENGFTIIELTVILVIVGALAAIAIPAYNTMVQQAAGQAAENNLLIIYQAERSYYFSNGTYCVQDNNGQMSTCGDTFAHLNANLNLNLPPDNTFNNYNCQNNGALVCNAEETIANLNPMPPPFGPGPPTIVYAIMTGGGQKGPSRLAAPKVIKVLVLLAPPPLKQQ